MPSTYTHYQFAEEVFRSLPAPLSDVVAADKTIYLIGAHGADILFYHKPLKKNAVRSLGSRLHLEPAAPFFLKARHIVQESAQPKSACAYLYGFLTHFALDSACHGYVAEKTKDGVSHTAIETELDRALLVEAGLDPLRAKLTGHLSADRRYAEIIAPFFGIPAKNVRRAIRGMIACNDLLVAPCPVKRAAVKCVLQLSGHAELKDLLMGKQPDPACADSCAVLRQKMEESVPLAVRLIESYARHLQSGAPLDEFFERNYE